MNGYRTIAEIIAGSGGVDGHLRENEISCGVSVPCDEFHDMATRLQRSGALRLDDYNAVKLLILKINTAAREMASRIRSLEESVNRDSNHETRG